MSDLNRSSRHRYIGRFAPSPTGPLHMGSLIAALASFLDARAHDGQWLMRIDDLDPPREVEGAAQSILESLKAHGLEWDGEVLWQSRRAEAYHHAIQQLADAGQLFYCSCSRKELAGTTIYPGHCRAQTTPPASPHSIRLRVATQNISFKDRLQGVITEQIDEAVGDFILFRKDGLFAYQLAVVVDDAEQQINQVVRGADLLSSTPRQIYLQKQLQLPTPRYAHLPVITNQQGQKLSKQTHAEAIDSSSAVANLRYALRFLGQRLPTERVSLTQLLVWATEHWSPKKIPPGTELIAP